MDRVPEGWDIILSDFSPGMLDKARYNLLNQPHPFTFKVIDAQSIPYESDCFDAVIANHFLYHVPERQIAFSEIRRVLKPGGHFYTSTIGDAHMNELPRLLARFDAHAEDILASEDFPFTLENGADQLEKFFSEVQIRRYPDELRVTNADMLAEYIFSTLRREYVLDRREDFTRYLKQEMAVNNGVITIKKDSGLFLAR
jgi:SAM-dependent methyltransferase